MNLKSRQSNLSKAMALLMVFMLLLTACGGGSAPSSSSQPSGAENTPAESNEEPAETSEEEATMEEPTEEDAEEATSATDAQDDPAEDGGATDAQDDLAEDGGATDAQDDPAEDGGATDAQDDPAEDGDATDTSDTPAEGPLKTKQLEFGVVPHLYYTDYNRALQLTKNAGFGWVRQQVVWKDMEMFEPEKKYVWDQLDPIVDAVNEHGLNLMISIVQSPEPYNPQHGLPEDPADLGNFVEAMAKHYGDKIPAYEIWNEQNLAHETGGTIVPEDVGHYVEILMECYTRIKAVDPSIIVLAGAPSTTGHTEPSVALADLDYYRAMYSYKDGIINDYFDVQAVHPAGSANHPDTMWPDNPSDAEGWTEDGTFYFRHIEEVRKIMEEYDMQDHQIWITEYGWATENTTPGYEFGNQISMEQQAEYITGAVELTYKEYPWVGVMFLWNLNFAVTWREHMEFLQQKENRSPEEQEILDLYWNEANPSQPLHEQASFGILNADWTPRPAYLELQELMAQIKSEQGR